MTLTLKQRQSRSGFAFNQLIIALHEEAEAFPNALDQATEHSTIRALLHATESLYYAWTRLTEQTAGKRP